MKVFNHQDQLHKTKQEHEPVEVRFSDTPDVFTVAYVLNSNSEYLTLLEITPETTFDGICIYPSNRVSSIKINTAYMATLDIDTQADTLLHQAQLFESSIKEYSFDGFLTAARETNTLIELMNYDNVTTAGQILDFNNDFVMINEYVEESAHQASQALINRDTLIRLAVDVPWLRKIKKNLETK